MSAVHGWRRRRFMVPNSSSPAPAVMCPWASARRGCAATNRFRLATAAQQPRTGRKGRLGAERRSRKDLRRAVRRLLSPSRGRADPGTAAVQTGIWYSPDIRFALFDVLIHDGPDDPGIFQPYAHVAAIAADADLDVVPLLARDTRSALDALPVRFPSRVPHM